VVTVSAPGKILLAGGYLVLEEANAGLVVGVDRRFYAECSLATTTTIIRSTAQSQIQQEDEGSPLLDLLPVTVISPQFDKVWRYVWNGWQLKAVSSAQDITTAAASSSSLPSNNPFVEKALWVALLYLEPFIQQRRMAAAAAATAPSTAPNNNEEEGGGGGAGSENTCHRCSITLRIAADNDFYSLMPHLRQRGQALTLRNALALPPFLRATARTSEEEDTSTSGQVCYCKTGLGSSACLVSAITGALVHTFLAASPSEGNDDRSDNSGASDRDANAAAATKVHSSDSRRATMIASKIAALSQIGHCHAQGKVGSGFDVSAACHGSHVYRRFPMTPELSDLLAALEALTATSAQSSPSSTASPSPCAEEADLEKGAAAAAATAQRLLCTIVDDAALWSGGVVQEVHAFSSPMPPAADPLAASASFLQIMMADVSGGSESPSMARQVLAWKQQYMSSSSDSVRVPHWDDLAELNATAVQLVHEISTVTTLSTDDGDSDRTHGQQQLKQQLVDTDSSLWNERSELHPVGSVLHELRGTFQQIRFHLRSMGEAAGVPIEPAPQTALCDACMGVPGVVAALVPGAGGYDAVACLYVNLPSVRADVANLWANWQPPRPSSDDAPASQLPTVCALTVQGVDFGDGVRVEKELPTMHCDDA
jgi:phosphomevalonate kinase